MDSSRGLPRCATVTVMILVPVLVLVSLLNSNGSMAHLAVDPSIITELTGHIDSAASRNALGNISQQLVKTSSVPNSKVTFGQSSTGTSSSIPNLKRVFGNMSHQSIITKQLNSSNLVYCKDTLPTAIVVGIQKCGTSALGKFLDLHPQVHHARGEVKFFSTRYSLGLDWYKSRLPCAMPGQIVTEKSPGYFYRETTVRRIYDMKANIKLLLIVKDPIVRAQSHYAMGHGANASGFQKTIIKSNGEIDPQSYVIDYSIYSRYMKPWLDVFSLDQICFIDGHSLEQHPEVEMKKVEAFLNISSFFRSSHFILDTQKGKPCFYKRGRKRCLAKNKGKLHPPVSAVLQKKLEAFFHPLNEKFFSMIHTRFEWGY